MSHRRLAGVLAVMGFLSALAAGSALAQATGAGAGYSGPPGNEAKVLQQLKEAREERIKTSLAVTDDEWKTLQPLLRDFQTAKREATVIRLGVTGRRGPGGLAAEGASPVQQARKDLETALENKDATPEDVAGKLKAFREARDKAREKAAADLAAAQTALKKALSPLQEARLVQMGILD